jgi:predicted aspartyl protease
MSMHNLIGLTLLLLGTQSAEVWAACRPLTLLNKIQMIPAKDGALDLVPVKLNGVDKYLLFDTGGVATQISPRTARELNLPVNFSRNVHLVDVNGNAVNRVALVGTFLMGRLAGSRMTFPVMSNARIESIDASGLAARDLLFGYDVDVDFGSNILSLFSKDHCDGNVVYWKNSGVGIVPMHIPGGHIEVQVTLDGHQFDAVVDTGSETSILSQAAADNDFGSAVDWSHDQSGKPVNGDASSIGHYHSFAKLSFGDVTVTNPHLLVMPDEMASRTVGNMHIRLPKLIIGMNILRHLHAYFAVGEDKLYVSAASQPETNRPDADTAPDASTIAPAVLQVKN